MTEKDEVISNDRISYLFILIVALFLVADLFLHPGRSITFDGHVHITTIAQFYNAIRDGEFPARWANGFANYGLPIPLVAHQTTSYLGAFFQFFTHNAVQSYNLVILVGVFLSTAFFYKFLRYYFSVWPALAAAVLFHFAPYRIANIYVRGAIPELFGSVFLPVVLIGVFQSIQQHKRIGFVWIIVGTTMLALTHPMMLVLSSVVIVPYAISLLWPFKKHWMMMCNIAVSGLLGLLIAGYYLVPLLVEIKYFSYGTTQDHFRAQGGFLTVPNFFIDNWSYFGAGHPGPRSNTLTMGSIETVIFMVATALLMWSLIKKKKKNDVNVQVLPWIVTGLLSLFLMTTASLLIYQHFFLFNNVQYPWRNLSALMFVSPFLVAWLLTKLQKPWFVILVIVIIAIVRFPQTYGKNFMVYDLKQYDTVTANLHTNNMNTLWMGDSRDYPERTEQYKVIEGKGSVQHAVVKNSDRRYTLHADEPIRMADYTFYFPGWQVYIDGQPTTIQFQDPAYRGMITYLVPAGDHVVQVKFEQTKIRILGNVLTVLGLISTAVFMWLQRFQKSSPSAAVRK